MRTFQARTILKNPETFIVSAAYHIDAYNFQNKLAHDTGVAIREGKASMIKGVSMVAVLARHMMIVEAKKVLR